MLRLERSSERPTVERGLLIPCLKVDRPEVPVGTAKMLAPLPAPGDIVYSVFPELKGVPAAKPRPALVVAIIEFDDGTQGVRVAYGTSKKTNQLHSGEFAITSADGPAYSHAGLSFDTKFDLRNQADLPYTEEWFRVPPAQPFGQSPKLGVLHPSLVKRAQAAFNALRPSQPE